ncbi:MAG: family 10 glycosylhydrolase [Clostridia bacterium]|nr:family 10 glycosylhydrolase [Clostridia bacterium]
MRKIILLLTFLLLCGCTPAPPQNNPQPTAESQQTELRGVWIPYFELDFEDKTESGFKNSINDMFSNIKSMGMNTVFVHIRANSDAFYNSKYFPYSKQASGTQGIAPDYDPLKIMVSVAHKSGLQIHAWINPFRVSNKQDMTDLSHNNPAKKWLTDNDKSNDNWVKKASGGLYYNPAIPQVQSLVINGVREVVENYQIDGIHLDDYFYPTTNTDFDATEYAPYKDVMTVDEFRRANVNMLISGIYRCVKAVNEKVVFGISPQANMSTNYNSLYADIEKWVQGDGYIDYIMPQIYFGFNYPDPGKFEQSFKFDECAKYWSQLVGNSKTKLYVGLGIYKSGVIEKVGDVTSDEWVNNTDIIARQVKFCRQINNCSGFCIYSYSNMSGNQNRVEEMQNLTDLLKITD